MVSVSASPPAASLRRWLVVRLVRWADRGWTASYSAYVRCDKGELPWGWHRFWTRQARRIDRIALGLARKLDKSNRWLGQEMIEAGWWG